MTLYNSIIFIEEIKFTEYYLTFINLPSTVQIKFDNRFDVILTVYRR
jgi:hypothetical protein